MNFTFIKKIKKFVVYICVKLLRITLLKGRRIKDVRISKSE